MKYWVLSEAQGHVNYFRYESFGLAIQNGTWVTCLLNSGHKFPDGRWVLLQVHHSFILFFTHSEMWDREVSDQWPLTFPDNIRYSCCSHAPRFPVDLIYSRQHQHSPIAYWNIQQSYFFMLPCIYKSFNFPIQCFPLIRKVEYSWTLIQAKNPTVTEASSKTKTKKIGKQIESKNTKKGVDIYTLLCIEVM